MPSQRSILSRLPFKERMGDIGGKYSQEQASFPAGKTVSLPYAPKGMIQPNSQEKKRDDERNWDILLTIAFGHRDRTNQRRKPQNK